MPERPIIMSAPMVRAIIREIKQPGTGKTETRRIIKPHGQAPSLFDGTWSDDYVLDPGNTGWRERDVRFTAGDRLWVRESITRSGALIQYVADHKTSHTIWPADWKADPRPSIHMPRWASRITLAVTEVRVERLRDIDDAGAEREGIYERHSVGDDAAGATWTWQSEGWKYETPRRAYAALWDSLHGDGAWNRNDWVAVIRFVPTLANIDAGGPR